MSDLETALADARRLLAELQAGRLAAYLDLHRVLLANGLHPVDLGSSHAALRRHWRDGILAEARAALEALKRGDRNQYLGVTKILAIIAETPEAIGTTAEELRSLWKKAAFAAARDAASRFQGGDRQAYDEVLDHLAILDADPETLGLTHQDMRELAA